MPVINMRCRDHCPGGNKGGVLLGALLCGVAMAAAGAGVTHLVSATAGGFAAANAAVESAIGIGFKVLLFVLAVVVAAGIGWWAVTLRHRREDAEKVALLRRSLDAAKIRQAAAGAREQQRAIEHRPITVDAVRVDELTRERKAA